MFLWVGLLLLLVLVAAYVIKRRYSHWERRGFPYDENSKFPYGCLESVSKRQKSMGMAIHDVYLSSKERFVGIYLLFRPAILVRDVELVRRILTQDFSSFHDRGIYVDEEKDPLSGNLFALPGQSWRNMRMKLLPCFTAGKLKGMFDASDIIANNMINHLNTVVPAQQTAEVDLKDIVSTYATDIISSTIFGLEYNSFEDPNNAFINMIKETRKNNIVNSIITMLFILVPSLAKYTVFIVHKIGAFSNMLNVVKDNIALREEKNIVRKDMLQLLMQLRNQGKIGDDDNNWDAKATDGEPKGISIESITAQASIFFIAGQETTASAAAFTIFELAQYPELLQRAIAEVDETLQENGGKITYDSLQKMKFLDLCIQETLRKYPGLPVLNREATQDYTIPDTDLVIKKGTPILIPLYGIHRNAEYFPEPDIYDPERFLESNRNYDPQAYMPFGEGPRICIAQRMGRVNSKLAVVKILQNFNVEIMEKRELEFDARSIALIPKGGVIIKLSKRNI